MSGSGGYGGYIVVHHTTDPAQGEMLAELLRNEGIEARFRGAASTLIGIAKDMASSMAVEVPAEEEARAREFLRALEDTAVAAESSEQDLPPPPGPPPGAQSRDRGRRKGRRIALALSVVAALALLGTLVLYNLR